MNDLVRMFGRLSSALLIAPILAYRYTLSPLLGPRCRFAPSCSEYAIEAIRLRGPLTGLWLGACRIVRCHPFGGSGYDPVPGGEAAVRKGGTAPVQPGPAIRQKA